MSGRIGSKGARLPSEPIGLAGEGQAYQRRIAALRVQSSREA